VLPSLATTELETTCTACSAADGFMIPVAIDHDVEHRCHSNDHDGGQCNQKHQIALAFASLGSLSEGRWEPLATPGP
jgi:hypothetical protein